MSIKQYFKSYDGKPNTSSLDFVYCPKCGVKLVKKEIDSISRKYCTECQYIQYLNPLPGVCVLIEKNRKVLIGKRAHQSTESKKWCLPCGFVEHHETYLDAAHREVFEETGLKIEIMSLVNVSTNHINTSRHTIVPVLTASVVGGVLKPGDDLVELDWISKYDTLPEMAFEADEDIIKRYFENELIEIAVDPRFRLNINLRSNYPY